MSSDFGDDVDADLAAGHVEDESNADDLLADDNDVNAAANAASDPELEAIKARVREMEEEAEKLKRMQSEVDKELSGSPTSPRSNSGNARILSIDERREVDARSVCVKNVDYGATAEELEQHFHGCGAINRVTIMCNKYDGHPKGFAYVEFGDKDSVATAMALDESLFRGRQIKVEAKRTNVPGLNFEYRPARGRGFRGRGYRGRGQFGPMSRPRYRGRGHHYYSPY